MITINIHKRLYQSYGLIVNISYLIHLNLQMNLYIFVYDKKTDMYIFRDNFGYVYENTDYIGFLQTLVMDYLNGSYKVKEGNSFLELAKILLHGR